jgi:hypothetical protein
MRRRIEMQTSVLDEVSGRVNRLLGEVGASDRHKLDEYLDSVREIERSIEVAEARTAADEDFAGMGMERPIGIPALYADHAKLMMDMMVLAYQTDMTRVITFMLGHEGSNRNYLELGAKDGHHSLSHHKGKAESIALLEKIELLQSNLLADFFTRMASLDDGDGSLLDNSLIVAGGAHSDSNMHLSTNVPTLVVGRARDRVETGRHIAYDDLPLSNLHLSVMDIAGIKPDEYLTDTTDATGKLPWLAKA